MNLAKKLKSSRTAKDFTQEEVAKKLNVSRQTVSKWENEVTLPNLNVIVELCDLYDVSLDYLLRDETAIMKSYSKKIAVHGKLIVLIISLAIIILLLGVYTLFNFIEEDNLEVTTTDVPTVEEILELDPDADILMWEDHVYETGIDWVDELELKEDGLMGKIKYEVTETDEFKNKAANRVPIDAEVYSVKEHDDILIIKYADKVKRYYLLSEG